MSTARDRRAQSKDKIKFGDVVKSVGAAFFGVQSTKNRERDFTHGKPIHYIVAGLLATVLFVLAMWGLVNLFLTYGVGPQ